MPLRKGMVIMGDFDCYDFCLSKELRVSKYG